MNADVSRVSKVALTDRSLGYLCPAEIRGEGEEELQQQLQDQREQLQALQMQRLGMQLRESVDMALPANRKLMAGLIWERLRERPGSRCASSWRWTAG